MIAPSVLPATGKPHRRAISGSVRKLLAACAAFAMAGSAHADDLDTYLADFSAVISKAQLARSLTLLCNERDPAGAQGRAAKLAHWEGENEIRQFDGLTAGLAHRHSALAAQFDALPTNARAQILPQLEKEPGTCDTMQDLYSKDNMQLRADVRDLIRRSDGLGITPRSPAEAPEPEIVSLTNLSATLLSLMDEVASKAEAEENRKVRDARNDYAEAWLKAGGSVSVFGRITEADEMRDWRGDRQSIFSVKCRSFKSDQQEAAIAAMAGRNGVIAGTVRHFVTSDADGRITLDDCALSPVRLLAPLLAQSGDAAALVSRPLDVSEAYAGPGAGPSMRRIDNVIYDSDFSTRMDGFGNGYVDRDEAIYVLLKGGEAFLHEWPFPVTDVDTSALRKREPDKWFKWNRRGSNILLRPSDDGEIIELKGPSKLRPIGNGRKLDQEYYYLQIGMMGVRTDRSYVFRRNGEVDYSRSGFVAGNFATSYIIVAGSSGDERQTRRKYRFEDYALIITDADGNEERHFFAVRADANRNKPDEVFIRGKVYWEKDKEA